jgi:hypothetical protein
MAGTGAWGSFADGATQGVRLMSDLQQRKFENTRATQLDADNRSRYNDSIEYRDKLYDDNRSEIEGQKSAKALEFAVNDFASNPKTAHLNLSTAAGANAFLKMHGQAVNPLISSNKELRDEALKNPDVDKSNWFAGIMPVDDGKGGVRHAIMLNVRDANGNIVAKPWSKSRGKNDPVALVDPTETMGLITSTMSRYGYTGGEATVNARANADAGRLSGLQVAVPAPAAAPAAPTTAPVGTTAPVAPVTAAPSAVTSAAAPPEGFTPEGELDRLMGRGDAAKSTQADLSNDPFEADPPQPKSLMGRTMNALPATPPTAKMYYNEHRKDLVASGRYTPGQIADMDEKFIPGGVALPTALADVNPNKLTPGQVMSPKNQDAIVKDMKPATPDEAKSAVTSVQAPAGGRSGHPSRRQLADALILKAHGVLTSEQVTRYAQTGKLEKDELKSFNPEHDMYLNGQLVKKGEPKGTTSKEQNKERRDMLKMAEDRVRNNIKELNGNPKAGTPNKYTYSDYTTRMTEVHNALRDANLPATVIELAESPELTGVLTELYKKAVDMDDKGGWFTKEAKRTIMDAYEKTYGKSGPKPQVTVKKVNGVDTEVVELMVDGKKQSVDYQKAKALGLIN